MNHKNSNQQSINNRKTMYKLTRESKNGMHTTTINCVRFNEAFDKFIQFMELHSIEHFNSFGIPLDCDIKQIGFGLMFHAENEWVDITMTKTSTGDELGSGFIKSLNNSMENELKKFLNENQ